MPPDQNASQMRSIWFLISPVIIFEVLLGKSLRPRTFAKFCRRRSKTDWFHFRSLSPNDLLACFQQRLRRETVERNRLPNYGGLYHAGASNNAAMEQGENL